MCSHDVARALVPNTAKRQISGDGETMDQIPCCGNTANIAGFVDRRRRLILWTFHEPFCNIYWVGLHRSPEKVINLIRRRRCPGPSNDTVRR
jgi:hypothetical protein